MYNITITTAALKCIPLSLQFYFTNIYLTDSVILVSGFNLLS